MSQELNLKIKIDTKDLDKLRSQFKTTGRVQTEMTKSVLSYEKSLIAAAILQQNSLKGMSTNLAALKGSFGGSNKELERYKKIVEGTSKSVEQLQKKLTLMKFAQLEFERGQQKWTAAYRKNIEEIKRNNQFVLSVDLPEEEIERMAAKKTTKDVGYPRNLTRNPKNIADDEKYIRSLTTQIENKITGVTLDKEMAKEKEKQTKSLLEQLALEKQKRKELLEQASLYKMLGGKGSPTLSDISKPDLRKPTLSEVTGGAKATFKAPFQGMSKLSALGRKALGPALTPTKKAAGIVAGAGSAAISAGGQAKSFLQLPGLEKQAAIENWGHNLNNTLGQAAIKGKEQLGKLGGSFKKFGKNMFDSEKGTFGFGNALKKTGPKAQIFMKVLGNAVKQLSLFTGGIIAFATMSPYMSGEMAILEVHLMELSNIIAQAVVPFIQVLNQGLEALYGWWNSLNPNMQQAIILGMQVAVVIGLLAIGFGILSFAMSPINLILLAIIAVVAALYLIWQEFGDQIMSVVNPIIEALMPTFESLMELFGAVGESAGMLVQLVIDLFTGLWNFFEPIINAIMSVLGGFAAMIMSVVNIFMAQVKIIIDILTTLVKVLNALFSGDFSGAWDAILEGVDKVISSIVKIVGEFINLVFIHPWNTVVDTIGNLGIGEPFNIYPFTMFKGLRQTPIGYAQGGLVDGPSGTDKVPAMLTRGEMVLTRDDQKGLLGLIRGTNISNTYNNQPITINVSGGVGSGVGYFEEFGVASSISTELKRMKGKGIR